MRQQDTATRPRKSVMLFRAMAVGSVVVLLAMMLLTSADVVARYVFNSPIKGAFELTEIGLAVLVFLAMPLTTASNEHVTVDLLTLPSRALMSRVLVLVGFVIVAGTFAAMAWEVWEHAAKLQKRGTVTNSLSIPVYLVAFLVSAACAVSVFAAAVAFFKGSDE